MYRDKKESRSWTQCYKEYFYVTKNPNVRTLEEERKRGIKARAEAGKVRRGMKEASEDPKDSRSGKGPRVLRPARGYQARRDSAE